ncbi:MULTISPECIES: hypothetical protein [unclassified Oceanobacillus]|uniref:hypothetical protein n=1 Tax=unclassified Oceanobacillus TaxID=2630292 RepID=UPI001669C659
MAVIIDYLLIKISWSLAAGLFLTNGFAEFVYKSICFFILFLVVPLLWDGKTIGILQQKPHLSNDFFQ